MDRGDKNNSVENEAWIFRINSEGALVWMLKIQGDKPKDSTKSSDNCLGLSYSPKSGLATALIQTKSPQLRNENTDQTDFTLVVFDQVATIVNVLSVNFGYKINLQGFPGNLVQHNNLYYASGMSNGYATKHQSRNGSLDTVILRLEFFESLNQQQNACLSTAVISTSKVASKVWLYTQQDTVRLFKVVYDEVSQVTKTDKGEDYLSFYLNQAASSI